MNTKNKMKIITLFIPLLIVNFFYGAFQVSCEFILDMKNLWAD